MKWGTDTKKTTQTTNQNTQTDPWAPAVPYLTSFLGDLDAAKAGLGMTPDQAAAFETLKANAGAGNPWTPEIARLTNDTFATTSRTPMVDDAYGAFKTNLADVAAGKNQDILSDPRLQEMLKTVGGDVQNRITGMFAGAGRDITGNAAGQLAMGKGITQAQLPILMQEFARQQGRTDAANQALVNAGFTAAQTGQALDKDALGTRAGGVDLGNAAMAARDSGPNAILNLEQQMKQLPFEDMSLLASLLLPIAGLGQQTQGTQTTTGKTTGTNMGFGLGLKDIGTIGTALMTLSDERAKEDITPIGKTNDGQTIYRYRYKGDPEVQIGLIAQEVEQATPDAVREVNGVKMVDQDKATRRAAMFGSLSSGAGPSSMDGAIDAAGAIGRMVPDYSPGPRESTFVEDRRGMPAMEPRPAPRGGGVLPPEDRGDGAQSGYGLPELTAKGFRTLLELLHSQGRLTPQPGR